MGYKTRGDGTVYWADDTQQSSGPGAVVIPRRPKQTERFEVPAAEADLTGKNIGNIRAGLDVRDYEPPRLKEDRATFGEWAKNFGKEKNVQNYQTSMSNYATAITTAPNPAGDLSLVYAYAKAMDPDSAVREGEADAVANIQSIVDKTMARYQKELTASGGTFLPETREQLRREIHSKVSNLNKLYNSDRKRYGDIAQKLGVDGRLIIGEHAGGQYAQNIMDYWKQTKTPNPMKGTPGYRPTGNKLPSGVVPPKRQQGGGKKPWYSIPNAPRRPKDDDDEALINRYLR